MFGRYFLSLYRSFREKLCFAIYHKTYTVHVIIYAPNVPLTRFDTKLTLTPPLHSLLNRPVLISVAAGRKNIKTNKQTNRRIENRNKKLSRVPRVRRVRCRPVTIQRTASASWQTTELRNHRVETTIVVLSL